MANLIQIIYRDYIWPYKRIVLIIFLIILFIIAGSYAYNWYAKPVIEKKPYDDVANANRRNKTATLYFFRADWCPHCRDAKPKWDEFTQGKPNMDLNGYTVVFIEVDCTDPDLSSDTEVLISKYNIDHYPTIKLVMGEDVIDFDAKITKDSLTKFVNAVVV